MADEKIVTSIVANSDFSGLIADVQRVTNSLHKLQQEFAGSNRALAGQIDAANAMFAQTMLKTGQFSSHFVSLTSDVEKFGRNLDSGRLKLRDYFRVYQDHIRTSGGLIRDLAQQQVQLQNAVLQPLGRNAQGLMQYNVHIPRGLDLTKNKSAILRQELQIMNKVIQDGGVQLINWGKNTQWAGRQLTVGLTLPLVAFGKAAADAFKVADQELTRLTKVYGDIAGTSSQELGRIRKEVATTAKELSAAMGVNFAETISLAADIAATGKTGNELLSSISETTRLAVLGEVDRQEAMKATLAIQSAFRQNTEELAESINFLNAVENQTSTTLNDLVEAIPKAGPVIKGLGGSVEDLALYLTAMREGGINASEGANALKSALASLINPTDVAVKKFQGFGIDLLGIVNKNAGSTTDTLFALQAALDRLNPLQKQQAIEQLFGKFQYSRLNALFENLGRQGSQTLQVLDLMKASASELESVANRELAAVTESAAGRYKRAVESLKASLAGVGDDFLNIATKLVNVLNKIVEFGQKLPDPIKKILAFGGAFTAIIGPIIMLTGVLANFFGYIIKGLGHFKALFKGAEGFKLLTPEIIAARNASEMLGNEFYSDAKAADTLRLAIEKLNNDLVLLQLNATKATTATAGLGQVVYTAAGSPIVPVGNLGGPRSTIAGHPLLGPESRAAAHLNPRDPNDPASIFGLTLQPIPVNRKIGRTPQILMSERLPDIEGLTTIEGISTGVVAGEHARYAALMATLGMQSKQEIEALKKTIGLGGQVSTELIATFDDVLPITQRLTANAAAQSAAIVADLRAGKLTVEQAKAAIIAANAELERMLGIEITGYAASRGRTIDLTKAPLIDQPVVDVAGKPNTRGMFRKGIFRDIMDAVGRATRTRTLGGPYSIETTRRLNKGGNVRGYSGGGDVFYNNGDQVPGPSINADVVPAMLTPGEFVIRRDVAQQDPDGMRALNEGRAVVVPVVNANRGGEIPGYRLGNFVRAATASRTRDIAITGRFGPYSWQARNAATGAQIDEYLMAIADPAERMRAAAIIESFAGTITTGRGGALGRARYAGVIQPGHISREQVGLSAILQANGLPPMTLKLRTHQTHLTRSSVPIGGGQRYVSRYVADYDWLSNLQAKTGQLKVGNFISRNIGRKNKYNTLFEQAGIPEEKWSFVESQVDEALSQMLAGREEEFIGDNYGNLIFERDFVPVIDQVMINNGGSPSQITAMKRNTLVRGSGKPSPFGKAFRQIFNLNRGGMVPGYNGGGGVSRATLLARLGARFKYTGKSYEGHDALQVYRFNAMDVNGGRKYFGHIEGLSDKARGALYSSTLEFFNTSMIKGDKIGGKRMFMPRSFLTAMPTIAANALTWNRDIMTPEDILILEGIKGRGSTLGGSVGSSMALSKVYKDVFRANRGGMVPGYAGGGPAQYGYARGVQNRFLGGGILKMLAAMGIMAGGQQLGQRVGGGAGTAISTASSILPFMMMPGMSGLSGQVSVGQRLGFSAAAPLRPMQQSIFAQSTPGLGKFATGLGNAATSGNLLTRSLSKLLIGITRFTGVVGLAVGAAVALYKVWDNFKKTQEQSAAQFGMNAEAAQKAGLKYIDFNQKIKDAVDAQKLLITQNKLTYQNMASAGTPFRMTISEYKALRKEVKETMKTQIDMFNSVKDKDVPRVAAQLKTQFVAMGLSAEEASKRVYTVLQLSDKAALTFNAMSSKPFTEITNAQTAAISALKAFNFASQFENTRDQAEALNTALMAINGGIQDLYTKAEKAAAKKKQDFDSTKAQYEAEKIQLDQINLKVQNQRSIGLQVLENLEKQNPLIRQFANAQDSVVSLWQKMRIAARGYTGDLNKLNKEQADRLYEAQVSISQAVEKSTTGKGGVLEKQYQEYLRLLGIQKRLETATKGQSVREQINARDAIRAIDKKIKKINEEAEARKKALQQEAEDQDINVEIQKKRLEYQQKIAAGDMGGAAQAQLDLQQLINRQQTVLTERAIEEKRLADIAPLEREKERLSREQEKLADSAALAAESLDAVNKKLEAQKKKIDDVNTALTSLLIAKATGEGIKGASAAFIKALEDSGVAVGKYAYTGGAGGVTKVDPVQSANEWLQKLNLENVLNNKDITITATGKVTINGLNIGKGSTQQNPLVLGKTERNLSSWSNPFSQGPSSVREMVKSDAAAAGVQPGQFFTYKDQKGKVYTFKMREDGNITMVTDPYQRKFAGGPIQHFGPGGDVSGPGTSTSDSIPAMLSDGEYVIRASAVDHYGVDTFDALNAKKLKDGGPAGKSKNTETANLSGEIVKINRGRPDQILADIKAAYAAEPNIKDFKDRVDYYKAYDEWNKKHSFVIPPIKLYPAGGQEYPMGSLRRFVETARSQASGNTYSAFQDAILTEHGYRMFSPRSASYKAKSFDILNYNDNPINAINALLSDPLSLNKFSMSTNKINKLGSDLIAWCGAFVAWVAQQSGVNVSKSMFSGFKSTQEYKKLGEFKKPDGAGLKVGDIVWWDWAKKFWPGSEGYRESTPGVPDHVDIITNLLGNSEIETIGGGFGSSVGRKIRNLNKEGKAIYGSVTPNFLSFKDGGEVKKQNWFQRYVSRLTETEDQLPSWARDPFGMGQLLRRFAGQSREGDNPGLAAALLPLNFIGFGLGNIGGTAARTSTAIASARIAGQIGQKKKYRELIESIYQRKDLDVGGYKYPSYSIGTDPERIVFQGPRADLSEVSKAGVRVIPTTPVGILKEAIRRNPKDKSLQQLLKNFEENKIGKEESLLLDNLLAASTITKTGKASGTENPDAFAMVLASLLGDVNATKILNVKREALYQAFKKESEKKRLELLKGDEKGVQEGFSWAKPGPIDMSSVPVIHSTKFPVVRNPDGSISLYPTGHFQAGQELGVPRASIHTTLEAPVESHMFGQWGDTDTRIVSPLSSMIADNDVPHTLRSDDTWWMKGPGEALKMTNASVVRSFNDAMEYSKELIKRGLIIEGQKPPVIIEDPNTKEVLYAVKKEYTDEDRFEIFKAWWESKGPEHKIIPEYKGYAPDSITEDYVRSKGAPDLIGKESSELANLSLKLAKKQVGINTPSTSLSGWGLEDKDKQEHIYRIAMELRKTSLKPVQGSIHMGSPVEIMEKEYVRERFDPIGFGSTKVGDSIEAARMAALHGNFHTGIRAPRSPFFEMGAMGGHVTKNGIIPKFAGGGYVNPAYFSDMSMPSYFTGAKYVYNDTIAQLHKGEMVVPSAMNPNNPFAMDTAGGPININNNLTINATPGMDTDELVNKVFTKVERATSLALAKSGRSRAI